MLPEPIKSLLKGIPGVQQIVDAAIGLGTAIYDDVEMQAKINEAKQKHADRAQSYADLSAKFPNG